MSSDIFQTFFMVLPVLGLTPGDEQYNTYIHIHTHTHWPKLAPSWDQDGAKMAQDGAWVVILRSAVVGGS